MYSGKSDKNPNKPLYTLGLLGLGLFAFGVFMYFDLAAWENTNEQKHMHSILWGLYDLGGKLAVSGFFWIIGLALIIVGIKKTKNLRGIKDNTRY